MVSHVATEALVALRDATVLFSCGAWGGEGLGCVRVATVDVVLKTQTLSYTCYRDRHCVTRVTETDTEFHLLQRDSVTRATDIDAVLHEL